MAMNDSEIQALVVRALARDVTLAKNEVNVLLRACLVPSPGNVLVAVDYSTVEPRWNAFASGDHTALAGMRIPGSDLYKPLACRLFGIDPAVFSKKAHAQPRDTSKKAEIACGYGMGAPKFRATAEKGGMAWKTGRECATVFSSAAQCVDPLCGLEGYNGATHGSETIVRIWREVHDPIVQFWHALNDAAISAAGYGEHTRVGPYEFGRVGQDTWAMLPSGRPLVYRGMRVTADTKGRPRLVYQGTKGPEDTYGGKLCENLTQACCRDLLAHSLAKAEDAGLQPVLHVHDEIVCDVPGHLGQDALGVLEDIMLDLPEWARGFPVAAEGFQCLRYRK